MKLTHYSPAVDKNTINARVQAPPEVRTFASGTQGLEGMQRAIGIGLKVYDDNMMADTMKAINEYQKRVDELNFNPDNGLYNLQNENAKGVTGKYTDGAAKIRDEVLKDVPSYGKARDAFLNAVGKIDNQNIEMFQKKEYSEAEKYKQAQLNDSIEQAQISIDRSYKVDGFIGNQLGNVRQMIYANYAGTKGLQACKDMYEQTAGKLLQSALAQAAADDDQNSITNIVNSYGPLVNPQYIRNFVADNNKAKKQNFILNSGKSLFAQFGDDMASVRKYIAGMKIKEPTTGTLGAQAVAAMAAQEGYPSYLESIGGTTCAYWATMAVHNVDPKFPVIDNVDTLVDKANELSIYHQGDGYKGNPGDLVVINYPGTKHGHTFMIGQNGTVWNAGGKEPLYNQTATPEEFAKYCGGTIDGIVAISQLNGGGMGEGAERALTPAEQEKVYSAYIHEKSVADGIKNQQKRNVVEALQNQAAEMARNGVSDPKEYLRLADGYKGTEMYASAVRAVSRWARTGRGYANGGVNISGSDTGEVLAMISDVCKDGSMNESEMENMLTRLNIQKGSTLWNKAIALNKGFITGTINLEQLKNRWENTGHKGSFKKSLPYLMNYLSGELEAGNKPTQEDAWNVLEDAQKDVIMHTSSGDYSLKAYKLFNSTGIYSYDTESGAAYIEGEDTGEYISGDDLYKMAGGIPVDEGDNE